MTARPEAFLGFRPIGGLRAARGRQVREGLLYRSGTPQFLTAEEAQDVLRATGLRTIVDLRLDHERLQEGSGPFDELPIRQVAVPFRISGLVAERSAVAPMDGADPLVDTYVGYLDQDPAAVASLVRLLAEPDALPALIHCTVGKDRTGAAIALVLDAIGVDRDEIAAEYAAGAAEVAPAMERLRSMRSYGAATDLYPPEAWSAPPEVMQRFLRRVDERHGGVRAFLARHGVPGDAVDRLAHALLG